MTTSPRKMDPGNLESTAIRWKRLHCSAMGCESGRQDSNLRPLVPQTSPYFPPTAEFDLECFRREMVGMTTRARLMESVGIALTSSEVYGYTPRIPHLPSSPLFSYPELGRIETRPPWAHGMTVVARVIRFDPPRRLERKTGVSRASTTTSGGVDFSYCFGAAA
jgi:hypothetical protein